MATDIQKLADELMAMAPSVEAATAEGGGAVLREAAYQLRVCHDLKVALHDILDGLHPNAGGTQGAIRDRAKAAISKAEGRS